MPNYGIKNSNLSYNFGIETIIGKVGNKNLYRTCLRFENTNKTSGYHSYKHNISDMESVFNVYGSYDRSDGKNGAIPVIVPLALNSQVSIHDIMPDTFVLSIGSDWSPAGVYITNFIAVFEYTKTTD